MKQLRIGHCVLAYRQNVKVQTAFSLQRDAIWATSQGHVYQTFYLDMSSITRARNRAVERARANGLDILVMQDADCYVLQESAACLLKETVTEMLRKQAACCGAVFICRGVDRMNAEPARPGESYEGEVGTGYMAIDMRKLKELPTPWFEHHCADDGYTTIVGEDIYFCRKVKEAGHKALVWYKTPTGHAFDGHLRCHPDELAKGVTDIVYAGNVALQR